jgi:seryl-tRNA synthetase
MIDSKILKEDPGSVRKELAARGKELDLDALLAVDKTRRDLQVKFDGLRAEQKQTQDPAEGKALKDELKQIEQELKEASATYSSLVLQLPNFSHESVPVAEDESGNVPIKTVGEQPAQENPLPHYEIPAIKPLIDFERGAKVSGSRFWYLKGALVNLEFALVQYALDFYQRKGFTPMRPPTIVNQQAMEGTGFFPADANEIYTVEDETDGDARKFLSGTAEVPLASYHAGEKLEAKELPVKYIGFAPAYRREAGSYGKDTKGIIRGHEFDKLELFVFADPQKSWEMHEELQQHAEEFWTSLGIPFQVVNIASGDLGAPNAKKLDIEAWMPGEGKYREVASNSNDTDFQARRLGIKSGKEYVHTLNNTACAIGRAIVAIVENYQQEDGTVVMPDALHQYLPFKEITKE